MILLVLILAAVVILEPLAAIWALNTLFGLSIAYTFKTWCAALLLSAVVHGSTSSGKSN